MSALGLALAAWSLSALAALLFQRWRGAAVLAVAGAALGGFGAAVAAAGLLITGSMPELWSMPWTWPGGALALRLDALAAAFLLPVAVIGALCAIYGVAYLRRHAEHQATMRPIASSLAAYNLLLLSMALVVTADNVVLLLLAWELMTLSSWALVVSDHETPLVRAAGLQYLIAGHLATAALILFGLLLAQGSGTFSISGLWLAPGALHAAVPTGMLFMLAVIGFGTKAGIVPMHVWLPDAHPAAPSHVSALMSAVMITMGFYGLARFIPILGSPSPWWGYLLMTLGAAGAASGIAFGVAQKDIKRILAYSTVENAGVVTLAVGVGLLGTSLGDPALVGLAWTAAILHVWNHALAKTLLFLGFGAAAQAAGTRSLDALGGLLRRWPLSAGLLILGAASIVALPGLNVFTSEWLLLRTLFAGVISLHGTPQLALAGGIVALALTGGIAVACFTRLAGLSLLGSPRSQAAAHATAPSWEMWVPMAVCASGCLVIAAVPSRVSGALAGAVQIIAPAADLRTVRTIFEPLALLLPLLAVGILIVFALRFLVRRSSLRREDATWGCGYPTPTSRMQYTSTSFSEPLTRVLQPVLRTDSRFTLELLNPGRRILWPFAAAWSSETADRLLVKLYLPIVSMVRRVGTRLRAFHSARVTQSLRYIIVTVLVLLALLIHSGLGR